MSNALETLKANMWKVAHDKTTTEIGGGVFSAAELTDAYLEILTIESANFNLRTEVCELKLAQGFLADRIERLKHDNALMQEALKQVLDYLLCDDAKTMHDAIQVAKRANAAYRHVSGT